MLIAFGTGSTASAQSWDGGSSTWSTAASWNPDGVPVSGSTTALEFSHTGTTYISTNDLVGNFELNILKFSGGSAGNISLARSGTQSLVFVADGGVLPTIVFDSTSSAAKTINMPMVLSADTTVTSTVSSAGNLQLGAMSGAGALKVDFTSGTGGVLLAAASTHGGGVQLQSGRLFVSNAGAFGSGALTLSGGLLRGASTTTELSFTNLLNFAGNVAIFDGNNTRSFTFTNGGSVQGTNATHTITLGSATPVLTLGGAFTGAGNGLTFAGTGNVALGSGSGDSAANTYSGATTVSGSATVLNLNKAAGTNAVAGNLAVSNGTVGWARSNQIADTATVSQSGGTVALAADLAETVATTAFTGGTFTVATGASYLTDSLAITTAGSRTVGGSLTVGSGGLTINHDGTAATRNAMTLFSGTSGTLYLNGDLTFNNATAATTSVQLTRGSGTGSIDLGGGTRTFTINNGGASDDLQISASIINGALIKEGDGTLALLNTPSTYSGDTTINAGTLRAAATVGTPQTFSNQSTHILADTAGVTLDLNNINQVIGGLSGGGSTGGTVSLGSATVSIGNNNASTAYAGAITGTGGLTKIGTGTLTLGSNLAYTGSTLVSNGKLVINGQLDSSGVVVNGANASLGGSGRVNALTITQGTFGPGNSPGTFTVDGNVSFGAASTFAVEAVSAASYDKLVVNGLTASVSIDSAATLSLSGFDALPALTAGTEFILIENNGTGSIAGSFAGYDEGHSFTVGSNTFMTSYLLGGGDNNDFGFVVTSVVPEPSTVALLAGLTGLALAALRRRR